MPDNHDDTDVQAALARDTHDGAGDIPAGDGDYNGPEVD